jgi:hypothetical protein
MESDSSRVHETLSDFEKGFFTELSPNPLKRLIPGFNSMRRMGLQRYHAEELDHRGYDGELAEDPLGDYVALGTDIVLLTGYIIAAYQVIKHLP